MTEKEKILNKVQRLILDESRSISSRVASVDDVDEVTKLSNQVTGLLKAFDLINEELKGGRS